MSNTSLKKEAYNLPFIAEQIERILQAVQFLNSSDVKHIQELLQKIIDIDASDNNESFIEQLTNALENNLNKDDVQTELNNSTLPPQTKVVTGAIESVNADIQELEEKIDSTEKKLSNKITIEQTARKSGDSQLLNQTQQAINTLKNLLYRQETEYSEIPLSISKDFDLSFVCKSFSNNLVPHGTWVCSDLSNLYDAVKFNGESILKHFSEYMAVTDIAVTDGYLENDRWVVYIDININPDDIDAYPVGSLCGYSSEKIFDSSQLSSTYIANVTESYVRIALGTITLPDSDVTVSGSNLTLSVSACDLGTVLVKDAGVTYTTPIIGDINDMDIDEETIIDAINYLNSKIISDSGTWHYGTELTHTENLGDSVTNNNIKANVGDFYLNKNMFTIYFCVGDDGNNHNWLYIGNLTGSFDYSKYAALESPTFIGTPTAPTPPTTNNSSQIATTEFVRNAIEQFAPTNDGNDNSTEYYRTIKGLVTFENIPEYVPELPKIITQKVNSISERDNSESSVIISVNVTGSVEWHGYTYTATVSGEFEGASDRYDEKFTNLYIKYDLQNPSKSELVFDYDSNKPVTDDYIIIPIIRVETKFHPLSGDIWELVRYTPTGYTEIVGSDTFVLKSQLDALESRIAALEKASS